MEKKFALLFNELKHKYMDTNGNLYTSMTTVIGKYEYEFDKLTVAKRVVKKKESKYYGWSVPNVLKDWDTITARSHVKGNKTHNYLEDITKRSTNFKHDSASNVKNYETLYTVDDIVDGSAYGELDPEIFLGSGIKAKYPRIYNLFTILAAKGYKFYSEIGVYNIEYLISGLIDILCVNHELKEFIIVDWKTNKHDLIPYGDDANKWLSGYFKKDKQGNETNEFMFTNQYFKYPLDKFQAAHYLTYAFQLNGYAFLFAKYGFKLNQLLLCHVRDEKTFSYDDEICHKRPEYVGLPKVEIHNMVFLQNEVESMFNHFANGGSDQSKLKLI
jgi:hypothetical protein